MQDQEKLLQLYKDIEKLSPGILLSGSFALRSQGIKLPRDPHDLDIYVPKGVILNIPKWLNFVSYKTEYSEVEFERIQYEFNGIDVDFFIPQLEHSFYPIRQIENFVLKVNMLDAADILAFKVKHSMDDSISREKHKSDVIYILQNN